MRPRRLLLLGLVAFLAAVAGVFAGERVLDAPRASETELHALLHGPLERDAAQQAKIERIETRFAVRRQALAFEMRAANVRLAEAIEAERGYGPRVTAAIDHMHMAMGALQKEMLGHVFAIRAVLGPAQAAMFDRSVVEALTADVR